jgi:glycerol-3-phosphate dehydrogenase (NAD(P)+)
MNIVVIGAGAWGTALAIAFAGRHRVCLQVRDGAQAALLQSARENARYLPGCPFPDGLSVAAGPAIAEDTDLVVIATPMAGLRTTVEHLVREAPAVPFVWACKGLESGTGLLPHQVVAQLGVTCAYGALTGPSFAEEVARGLPTAIALASSDAAFLSRLMPELNGSRLRLYANEDLVGAEVGGAVKNVLAIATGICDGLGLGLNARAALVTRGLAEITRFGVALGARTETFMGLTGMGDLILTCTGDLSRNRRVGLALAQGRALGDITRDLGHVAEGVLTAREVARRAALLNVDMPITAAVCGVLDGALTPVAAVDRLMARDPRGE